MNNEKFLLEAEKRFKKTAKLAQDISPFPLSENITNIDTNKEKSKEFSEVFTPLWLVDQMISQVKFSGSNSKTLDLCAGYGQFSIRLMRYFYETYPDFDVSNFIKENHAFSELQLSSCYKLLNIFGNKITLFIGDSTHLNKLPPDAKGLWCYIENYGYWVCLTKTISAILSPNGIKEKPASEAQFVSSIESIVKGLNETYINMKDFLNQLTNSKLRLELIDQINERVQDGVKIVPPALVSEMLDKVEDLEKKSILVLYNCEIVEQLVAKRKIDPKQITFGDTFSASMKSDAMKKMYGVETISFGSEVAFLHSTFKGRKFDVCLSNPPYNDNLHLKILMALLGRGTAETSIAKQFIFIHPMNWLIDLKAKEALFHNFKALVGKKFVSLDVFNGNPIFDITLHYPCGITNINLEHTKDINVSYFGETYLSKDINDITKYGNSYIKIVEPFFKKIKSALTTNGDITKYQVKAVANGKHYCQLAGMRGHESQEKDNQVKTDFYTVVTQDSEMCKGLRKSIASAGMMTFAFLSENEVNNYIEYLKTDFARFCLSLIKINGNNHRGELKIIPAMDFTQVWDDDKLFKHFDVNKDTQDYIRKFLPDYYGIRK